MATSARDADQLVEEGLQLYSQGRFDAALSKWREALLVAPQLGRAIEYIDYVEANREALEQTYARNAGGIEQAQASEEVIAPFGDQVAAPEVGSDPGSFFEADVDEVAAEPVRGGAADDEQGGRHRRHTQRSFMHSIEPAAPEDDPFGSDEPTPVSLIEDGELKRSSWRPTDSRPTDPTRDGLEPLEDELLEDEPARKSSPALRKAPPRAAGPGMPRRRAVGVPPPLPRGAMASTGLGEMPPTQPMRAMQSTPSIVPLDDLLSCDERAALDAATPVADDEQSARASQEEVVVEAAPPSQSYEDLARRYVDAGGPRVDTMLAGARELYDQGTFEGSLWLCQKILGIEPDHAETRALLQRNQQILVGQYEALLGDLRTIPIVCVSAGDIVWHKLDHRAGFLMSRIDGMLSYEDVLDISGMDRFEALRILAQLVEQGVVDKSP